MTDEEGRTQLDRETAEPLTDVEGVELEPGSEAEAVERVYRRRPGKIVAIGVSFKVTVVHIGDALVTDGTSLYELGPGTWRVVDEAIYDRIMRNALVAPTTRAEAVQRRRGRN